MTAVYIIAGILILCILIAFSSIKIRIAYDEQIKLSIGFWFFNYKILPSGKKGKDKKHKSDEKKPKDTKKKKEKNVSFEISEIIELTKYIISCLKPVLKSVRIRPLIFRTGVSADDAAATAIATGAVNAIVWPFAGWLSDTVHVRGIDIAVNPAYENDSYVYFKACIKIRLNHIIASGFNILVGIYKLKFSKDGAVK